MHEAFETPPPPKKQEGQGLGIGEYKYKSKEYCIWEQCEYVGLGDIRWAND